MRHSLEKEIKLLLWKNQSKKQVFRQLVTENNREELIHLLDSLPSGNRRKKTFLLTLFIVLLLLVVTAKQFLIIFLYGRFDTAVVLALIGPIIHFFIIRELLFSHRLGYQLLAIVSLLALFRQENRVVPDMYIYICLAALSAGLYLFLFPKSERMQSKTD